MKKSYSFTLIALMLAGCFAFAICCTKGSREKRLLEWGGSFAKQQSEDSIVIYTNDGWKKLWTRVIGTQVPIQPDFSKNLAVAVFLGQRFTGGYDIKIHDPVIVQGKTVVVYEEIKPDKDAFVVQTRTTPYRVVIFEKLTPETVIKRKK